MHIGLDDTDSTKGGCTTYLTAVLIEKLEKFNVQFIDYPGLIRLNPNVPWKTRGNGALCLRFTYSTEFEDQIKETALDAVGKTLSYHKRRALTQESSSTKPRKFPRN